jgi:hypothetical protein
MIAKIIKSGASFSKTANYLLNEKKLSADGTQKPSIIAVDGVCGDSADAMASSFEMQALMSEQVKNTVGHIALSFLPDDKDKLTDGFMVQLAQEYMEKMKIENTSYAVIRHYDGNNPHCHILYSRVNNKGKVISDSNDRYRSMTISREMEQLHGLSYSESKKNVNREKLKGADAIKYEIYDALETCLPHCKDWEDLSLRLEEHDVHFWFKYKGGTDIKEGVIFEKDDQTFSGSKIDRKYSFANIEKQFAQSQMQSEQQSETHSFSQETSKSNVIENVVDLGVDMATGVLGLGELTIESYGSPMYRPNEPIEEETDEQKKKPKKGIKISF